jgi:mono/diheme cytochrome c family protein
VVDQFLVVLHDRRVSGFLMKRLVDSVQVLAVAATVWTVFLLFTAQPPVTGDPVQDDGARIYAARCSGCHGGAGQGLSAPALAGRVAEVYPEIADQIAVVANGRGGMPAFGSRLTAEELDAVVEFTRSRLGA